jgi:hypothetical protein
MTVRASTVYAAYLAFCLILLACIAADAGRRAKAGLPDRDARRSLVKTLSLTDLVLFTDARYSRHPSMADRHSPFQDHPLSLEHFPSGSLIAPPPHMSSYGNH